MSQMPPTICTSCRQPITGLNRSDNPRSPYCLVFQSDCMIYRNLEMYGAVHNYILRRLAILMAGPYESSVGWNAHKILVVHVTDAAHGGRQYVHHELEVRNFVETIYSLGLGCRFPELAIANISDVMILLRYNNVHIVAYSMPFTDDTLADIRGDGDVARAIEALSASEERNFWPQQ
ncbi:hypothetical protein BD779DRAFT_1483051 [Infundibulicybe gibba]|nr:hypothetical protein BD779DRAFT_1483051 [Infundibulicybe gibba]